MTRGCDKLHACNLTQLLVNPEPTKDERGDHQGEHEQAENQIGLAGHEAVDANQLGRHQASSRYVKQRHRLSRGADWCTTEKGTGREWAIRVWPAALADP